MRAATAFLALFLQACSCGVPAVGPLETGDTAPPDYSELVYDPDHLLRVEIEIDADDWGELCTQTRDAWELLSGEDCLSEPFGSPFTYFPATVTIDGESFPNVGVRKKGFLGSLSESKPGLKIDLSEYGEEALFHDVKRLTLNNAISDASYLRQCLGYGFYRDSGMPASRCNYATVAVNGDELGVYVNVEPLKKAFLRRHFDDDEGNLYEGTLSDFREGWTGTFEKKTNESADDWSDIEAMVEALEAPDEDLVAALEPALNLDAFYTHWAAEVLSSHTDGYAWNTNNYYLYADPADGDRFHFIPWGIDAILYGEDAGDVPASVFAYGWMASRLYAIGDTRAAYQQRMRELLDGPWDEDVLTERMDRDRDIVLSQLEGDEYTAVEEAITQLQARMEAQRPRVLEALDADEAWPYEPRENWCFDMVGELSATFDTTWGSIEDQDPFTYGEADLSYSIDDELFEPISQGAVAGDSHGTAALWLAAWISSHEAVVAYWVAPQDYLYDGSDFELGFDTSMGALYYIDVNTMEDFQFEAYIIGSVELEDAGVEEDAAIVGSMSGELMTFGW